MLNQTTSSQAGPAGRGLRRRLYERVRELGTVEQTELCNWSGEPEDASWEVSQLMLFGNVDAEVLAEVTNLRIGKRLWK